VKEWVVHGLTVGKKYNAQVPVVHLGNSRPAANPSIALNLLAFGTRDHKLNPFEAESPRDPGAGACPRNIV
jgi:hypothetical protein